MVEIIVKKVALPLYDDPELVEQRLQPGHEAGRGVRGRDDGVGRRNLGSKLTMKYPAIWLMGERAHGEVLSIAFAGKGSTRTTGGKCVHMALEDDRR